MYTYKARVNRVLKSNMVNLTIDLGFDQSHIINCILYNVEVTDDSETKMRRLLQEFLPEKKQIYINSIELDEFGRPIVKIYTFFDDGHLDKISVNDYLLMENLSW